ncbi:MAG: hypothetical protein ACLRMW_05285 [[Clostridium] symbiosum]
MTEAGNSSACVSVPEVEKGEHIVIIGAGAIGMLAGMAALAYGGILIMDIVDQRLSLKT